MRIVTVLLAAAVLAAAGAAQSIPYAYVDVEPPAPGMIVVIHPSLEGALYFPDGTEWDQCDVQVGHSTDDPWGECYFEAPMSDAEVIVIEMQDDVDGVVLLDDPLPLAGPPAENGWTTVDLGNLHGGGFTAGPVHMRGRVPGYVVCLFGTLFELEVRSPDINADLDVDLTDVVLFVQALGEYRAYADLRPDGVVNLSDIVVMAQGLLFR